MNPQHLSETNEHQSPPWIVEGARETLRGIDLDPATTSAANELSVKAKRIYTINDDGLSKFWMGRIFLNPPGGLLDAEDRIVIRARTDKHGKKFPGCTETGVCGLAPGHKHQGVTSSASRWWTKLIEEWQLRAGLEAVFVGFTLELLQSCQQQGRIHPLDFATCLPKSRVQYCKLVEGELVAGTAPPHASFITLVSDRPQTIRRFHKAFAAYGYIAKGD